MTTFLVILFVFVLLICCCKGEGNTNEKPIIDNNYTSLIDKARVKIKQMKKEYNNLYNSYIYKGSSIKINMVDSILIFKKYKIKLKDIVDINIKVDSNTITSTNSKGIDKGKTKSSLLYHKAKGKGKTNVTSQTNTRTIEKYSLEINTSDMSTPFINIDYFTNRNKCYNDYNLILTSLDKKDEIKLKAEKELLEQSNRIDKAKEYLNKIIEL